jgi:phosphoglycolate phosphatase
MAQEPPVAYPSPMGDTGSMTNVASVVFDLDGTLTDSKPGIVRCLQSALQHAGVSWTGSLDWFIGPPVEHSMARLMPQADAAARDALVRDYRGCYDREGWAENAVYQGIVEVLAELQRLGIRMFVCTSKRDLFAGRILADFGLARYFEEIYADRGDRPHSKVELLGELIREQGVDPASAVMIGDRRYDIEAAHANGMKAIAVTYGYGSVEELKSCAPDAIIDSPAEILRILSTATHPAETS